MVHNGRMEIFFELTVLLVITTVVCIAVRQLKQPLVVGYIVAGIIAGPYGLNVLSAHDELEFFSKVGIVFLLFIVGLHLNPRVIREVGRVSLITGIGQVLCTSLIGFIISRALGIDRLSALYVSIALTLSSTIVILKLLADKKDLQKLYAKIAIGLLLVQDIVATLILVLITVVSNGGPADLHRTLLLIGLHGLTVGFGLLFVSSFILPRLIASIAASHELLFLFSLAWGTGLASLFSILGFSVEIGALVAGVTLSATPYAHEFSSRLKPLRDFFIVLFFLLLGSQVVIPDAGAIAVPAIILSVFVLIGNPVIVIILMNLLGFNRRTGFMTGMTVAQISEFSLILASLGFRVGHVSQEILSLITLVGLVTIAGSTYLIQYSEAIYPYLSGLLHRLELVKKKRSETGVSDEDYSSIIFGYDRVGQHFVRTLSDAGEKLLVVDFNPQSIHTLIHRNIPFLCGDAGDIEFLEELPCAKPRLIISTIPDLAANMLILSVMLARNKRVIVLPITHTVREAKQLYEAGASYVMMPHHLGAEFVVRLIKKHQFDPSAYRQVREEHLLRLEET